MLSSNADPIVEESREIPVSLPDPHPEASEAPQDDPSPEPEKLDEVAIEDALDRSDIITITTVDYVEQPKELLEIDKTPPPQLGLSFTVQETSAPIMKESIAPIKESIVQEQAPTKKESSEGYTVVEGKQKSGGEIEPVCGETCVVL